MKISELTENDCIHISTKKEAKGIAKLLIKKNYNITSNGDIVTWRWIFDKKYPYLTITNLQVDVNRKPVENIIPASKFLKQSISKKVLQEALSKVGEELSSMNERLGKLEAKSEPKTANGIEVHIDEVTEGLPEKWCIKLTKENYKVLKTGYELDSYIEPFGYHHSDKVNAYNHWEEYKVSGYSEITFETFKKYVLKEEVKEAQTEAIDFSKAGQLVKNREFPEVVVITNGEYHSDEFFTGTFITGHPDLYPSGTYHTRIPKEYYVPLENTVTLQN